ncbi:methylmalonyl-CoA mutase small subunit [Bacteroidales bacterium]|nr:methylmalonyl-CoA mutase small subunit [Bacteroidales bacterium]
MINSKEKLFSEFPPVSTKEWMERVAADLKGADFEKKLVWKTKEGFNLKPFYRQEDIADSASINSLPGQFPYLRGTKTDNDWYVRQDIEVVDVAEANKKALDILYKGINSIGFIIPRELVSIQTLELLLNGINLECVELNFKTCSRFSVQLMHHLLAYYQKTGVDVMKCYGSINTDAFGPLLRKGKDQKEWIKNMVEIVNTAKALPRFKAVAVNAFLFNNAGSFSTQELGYALAWGNELLANLIAQGVEPAIAAKKIKFNFGIGVNYFMEIAKFRAARMLWAQIVNAYKPKCVVPECENTTADGVCLCASKMNIFAQTSTFNQTVYDAHVNLLRSQTEAMSAGIAGVDSMLVSPFDSAFAQPNEFSERMARNQQLMLKEEAHFDKVVDASGGSYYIETLTESIAKEAWALFVKIDEKGFYAAVQEGTVQKEINATAASRSKDLANRKEILLGTNQFPNFYEKALPKMQDLSCGCGCKTQGDGSIETLNTRRLASDFEDLRLATEKSGAAPKAFMLTIGSLAMRLARSQFACNFFACGGCEVIDNLGFDTIEEGVEAARKAGAAIIVLCSSDDEYATLAPKAQQLMKGKETLVVAGAPSCMDELKTQGVNNFINVRSNVLDTLKKMNNE